MKTTKTILEGHEGKLCFDASQINFNDIHVGGIENEENLDINLFY